MFLFFLCLQNEDCKFDWKDYNFITEKVMVLIDFACHRGNIEICT